MTRCPTTGCAWRTEAAMWALGAALLTGCASEPGTAERPRPESTEPLAEDAKGDLADLVGDSHIRGPAHVDLVRELEALVDAHADRATLVRYGRSAEERELVLLRITGDGLTDSPDDLQADDGAPDGGSSAKGPPAVLLTGATHGNEYLHIVDRLPAWLLSTAPSAGRDAFFAARGVAYVVPVFNPDGYDAHRRRNASGVDLNRDFDQVQTGHEGFTAPETRAFIDYFEPELRVSGAELHVSMDYHCCTLGGALLYPWSYADVELPEAERERFEHIADGMRKHLAWTASSGRPSDIYLFRYPEGSSKDYYYTNYGTLAFTYEGRAFIEDDQLENHRRWWDWILGEVAAGL